jgi:N-acetylglucosamine kinase-like BadF-type ATPase
MGLDKSLVDGYIAGQEAIANTEVQAVHNLVGGANNYNKVIEYAKTNLNDAEQEAFNETLETGSIEQVKFAVQGIASRAGIGSEQPQSMINGDSIETNSDVFESSAQVIDAMNDPRYAKDPAFRKLVEEKIARSTAV